MTLEKAVDTFIPACTVYLPHRRASGPEDNHVLLVQPYYYETFEKRFLRKYGGILDEKRLALAIYKYGIYAEPLGRPLLTITELDGAAAEMGGNPDPRKGCTERIFRMLLGRNAREGRLEKYILVTKQRPGWARKALGEYGVHAARVNRELVAGKGLPRQSILIVRKYTDDLDAVLELCLEYNLCQRRGDEPPRP